MSTAPSGWRLTRGLILTGLAIGVIVAVGYAISRRTEHTKGATTALAAAESTAMADSIRAARAAVPPAPDTLMKTAPTAAVETATPVSTATVTPPTPKVAVPDTGVWEYAVAKTWVRVRSAPSMASEMLRMVDSAQRVRLGPPTNGWRPVRVGVDRGWVDPRLFTVLPAQKP